jgi:hypothetical protein
MGRGTRRPRLPPAPPGLRVCRQCGETKPLDGGFLRIKQGGYYGRCKACRAANRRARYRDDPAYRAAEQAKNRRRSRERWLRRRSAPRAADPHADAAGVLAYVAGLAGVPVVARVGPSRSSGVIAARTVAMHLLHAEAGLTYAEVGGIMGRTAGTVKSLTTWVRCELRQGASPAELARRVRKHPSGLARVAWSHRTDVLLPGLAACRLAAGLTQAELASRSGIAAATISHLERLQRPARAGTARVGGCPRCCSSRWAELKLGRAGGRGATPGLVRSRCWCCRGLSGDAGCRAASRPTAFFGALAGRAADHCVRAGLPVPRAGTGTE